MKKLFLSIAAMSMILATGCQNEELVQQTSADEYSLTLDMSTGSRTLHNEAGKCVWGDNEQLYVVGDGGKVYGTLTMKSKSADGKKAVFSGKVVGDPAKLRFMVYPVPETDGTIPMGNIDGTNHNAPMTGQINADGVVTGVDYAGGLIKVPVTGISDMVVNAENKEGKVVTGGVYTFNPVTGQLTFDPDGGTPIYINNIEGTNGFVYVPVETDVTEDSAEKTEEVTVEVTIGEGDEEQTQSFPAEVQQGAVTANDVPSFEVDENGTLSQEDKWDGTIASKFPAEKDGVFTITTAEELAAVAAAVNKGETFEGKTFVLEQNLNLEGLEWTTIGQWDGNGENTRWFKGTFDGNNYEIKNLTVDKSTAAGLFGGAASPAKIKNVTVTNVNLHVSKKYAGAILGHSQSIVTIENCNVISGNIIADNNGGNDGDKVGGIAGCVAADISGCVVENVVVRGYRGIGGLVGRLHYSGGIYNNQVKNSTIIQDMNAGSGKTNELTCGIFWGDLKTGNESDNKSINVAVLNGVTSVDEYPNLWTDGANSYCVYNAEGLKEVNKALVTNSGEVYRTIKLYADVDLMNIEWTPLDKMFTTFDGQGHTIKNLNVTGAKDWAGRSGFFAYLGGSTIQNLTLENVTSSGSQAGIFAGHSEGGKIINCKIAGENIVEWTGETKDTNVGNGIGIYVGVNIESSSQYTGEILEGSTVTLIKNNLTEINGRITGTNVYAGGLFNNSEPTINITNKGTINK